MQMHNPEIVGLIDNFRIQEVTELPTDDAAGRLYLFRKRVWTSLSFSEGYNVWLPLSQELYYAKFSTSEPQQDWVFKHNLKTTPVIQCFDTTGAQINPASVINVDQNTAIIHWGDAKLGHAVAVAGNPFGLPQADYAYTQDFTDATEVVVTHMLGRNPEVAVWVQSDTGGQVMIYPTINWINSNSFSFTLNSPRTGTVYCV